MEHEPALSSTDVCEITGITYRRLNYWTTRGVITPAVPAVGSGSARRWSVRDVRRLAAIAAIEQSAAMELPLPLIRGAWRALEHDDEWSWQTPCSLTVVSLPDVDHDILKRPPPPRPVHPVVSAVLEADRSDVA